ncbi:hypothetical protein SAMN05421548_101363 [Paraburkholderia lycopersici]|uniref:VCBS repeat-containing protein n=2 Tax=Paraburkholderia lycopersici TaxID=416944 RepID=A0A1G6GUV2_9BURK|nr:hypothetical protein SAMN05421548_101363 [Paraburkholderia lycopersici]
MDAAAALGPQPLPSEVTQGNAVAFGDFFQDGTYSMVTATCADTNCGGPGGNGTIHFYKLISGQWVDHTSDILSDNTGCDHPRKAIVADFNGSGKPGVFFACHGVDSAPFAGEQPRILLPQANGKYTNTLLPFTGYFHSASAADFNGKGYADIVVADPSVNKSPYFLVNNGDGTFTADKSVRLPATMLPYDPTTGAAQDNCISAGCSAEIDTAELIDFSGTGKFDLFLGGRSLDPEGIGNWIPTIFHNQGNNTYSQSNVTTLPYSTTYQTALDIVYTNNSIYLTNVQSMPNGSASIYGYSDIEKNSGTNFQTNATLWNETAPFANSMTWINWIIPYQGKIDAMNSTYNVSVSQ